MPSRNSGTTSTTGGSTISAIIPASRLSPPGIFQRDNPNAANAENASVMVTEPTVRITLFSSHRGNWSSSAVR